MRGAFQDMGRSLSSHTFPDNTYFVSAITAFDQSHAEIFTDQCHLTDEGKEICLEYILREAQARGLVLDREDAPSLPAGN